jgi:omega-6 fatty acid desaturase (delta-12 desaturase)
MVRMNPPPEESPARRWNRLLEPYKDPKTVRSLFQVANSAIPFAALWLLMLWSSQHAYWATLLLALPAAGLLVRLFIIQHDCGHGSFLRSKGASTALGSAIGVLTLTPYHYWKRDHQIHHATSGNLDKRGHGDIDTITVAEYRERSFWGRLAYRLYRNPLVLFVIGPPIHFLLRHRLPLTTRPYTKAGWASILLTDAALAGIVVAMALTIGLKQFLMVQLPITLLASSAGVWLFYVQHQFEGTYWRRGDDWSYHDAALEGSSHYDLGPVLQWFTGNIGLPHIHHLSSRIPNYRLAEALRENPELESGRRLTLLGSLRCLGLALRDEERGEMVGFRAARAAVA